MVEHERISQKKREKANEQHHIRWEKSQPMFEHFHDWDQDKFSVIETPFRPQTEQHASLLSGMRSEEEKANLLVQLQQTYGNAYVQRLLHSEVLQAKRVKRIIAEVIKDWDPPKPDNTPWVEVEGETLADVASALESLEEWGMGGGMLRAEPIPPGTSTDLTVTLHANLVMRLPDWKDYAKASAAAQKEWDRMIEKLQAHEERHVEIAIEECDKASTTLIGEEISKIAPIVTATNAAMKKRQDKLDSDTNHGMKKGVLYGDVSLDTSIE